MIFKDRSSQCRGFNKYLSNKKIKKRGGKAEALSIYSKASINYSREKSCVCGKHCGLPGLPGSM